MEANVPKKRRAYTVEAFLQRDLRRWKRMVLRPRASLLKDTRVVSGPLDTHIDRGVNRHAPDKHIDRCVDRHVYPLVKTTIKATKWRAID